MGIDEEELESANGVGSYRRGLQEVEGGAVVCGQQRGEGKIGRRECVVSRESVGKVLGSKVAGESRVRRRGH